MAPTDRVAAQLAHSVRALVERYDSSTFEPQNGRARVRLGLPGTDAWDVVLEYGTARTEPVDGSADALLSADARTWAEIVADPLGPPPRVDATASVRCNYRLRLRAPMLDRADAEIY